MRRRAANRRWTAILSKMTTRGKLSSPAEWHARGVTWERVVDLVDFRHDVNLDLPASNGAELNYAQKLFVALVRAPHFPKTEALEIEKQFDALSGERESVCVRLRAMPWPCTSLTVRASSLL